MRRLTNEEFINKANQVHNFKYNYSLVSYKSAFINIKIICSEHGEFEQAPTNHLRKSGCPSCGEIIRSKKRTLSNDYFLQRALQIHGNKYNYSKSKYTKRRNKVIITCPIHGDFLQTPDAHLSGSGCQKCWNDLFSEKYRLTNKEFIDKANIVHSNKYNYSKVIYENCNSIICITCPIHGDFWQEASNHLYGNGCSICRESRGEEKIRLYLEKNNIKFTVQEWFKNSKNPCVNKETSARLPFDFFLLGYNILIEYDGMQHFKPHSFGSDKSEEKKEKNFKEIQYRDQIKNQYCEKNNIKLLRIPYTLFQNIENFLEKELRSLVSCK